MPRQVPPGIPAFGFEDGCRAAGLATRGMLDDERREPAWGQKPAAYYWTGHDYALLWRYDDTVAKPPLSPGRQARYDANRTCARCRAKSKRPWQVARNSKRYCPKCTKPAMQELWAAERAAERPGLEAWARELLADERAVLVAGRGRQWVVELRAETPGGEILVDALVVHPHMWPEAAERMPAELRARAIEVEQAVDLLAPLGGRRLVSWWQSSDLVNACLNLMAQEPGGRGLHDLGFLRVDPGDQLGNRYARWVGEPNGSVEYAHTSVRQIPPAFEPGELCAQMRAAVLAMAAREPAEAEAA